MSDDIVLKTTDLTKHYGGVHALEGANFELKKGEHVAIMGDNGAGKSTFVRQITGVEQRTRGEIIFDGKPVHFDGPLDAREAGIETVFQTLALADDLDVPDNLFLGALAMRLDAAPVDVVTATDGEACFPDLDRAGRVALATRRRTESREAHRRLGLVVRRTDMGLPDGRLSGRTAELVERLAVVLARVDHVAVVDDHDGHPDHDAVGRATITAATDVGIPVSRYGVWCWNWDGDTRGRLAGARRHDLSADAVARKAAAVRAHASQVHSLAGRPPVLPASFLAHHLGGVEVVWGEAP